MTIEWEGKMVEAKEEAGEEEEGGGKWKLWSMWPKNNNTQNEKAWSGIEICILQWLAFVNSFSDKMHSVYVIWPNGEHLRNAV